jgi:hypothetical protein
MAQYPPPLKKKKGSFMFDFAVERIDFDIIDFVRIDFSKKLVECELIYV